MDVELKELEEELRGFAPSPISSEVVSRMVKAMEKWEDVDSEDESYQELPDSGKVISFPASKGERNSNNWKPMWAAAAAVAMMGAAVGAIFPKEQGDGVTAMTDMGTVPALRQASLVPVNIQRKVSSLDTGVMSNEDGTEYQVIRVTRQEEADFRSQNNVGLKISRPKVDYYIVPVTPVFY